MYPAPIRKFEYDRIHQSVEKLPLDAIWVWKEELTAKQTFIVLTTLADIHRDFDFVLLEIDYESAGSASLACAEPGDIIKLTCGFGAGRMDTGPQPIDLIINPVPATSITKLWEGNLLEPLQNRHPALEVLVC
jgi:hypothetical protein